MNWIKTLISKNSLINDAIVNLSSSGLRIVLVVDDNKKIIGTISDGDIRKGLLSGLELKSPIDEIINQNFIAVPEDSNKDYVLELMSINNIYQIPIVDKDQIVVGLFTWDILSKTERKNNIFFIMAGGEGIRLRPHTEKCPKPLIEVGGKPMLQHIIERAKKEGFYNFYIAINYLGNMIEDFLKDGAHLGVKIKYIKESSPLGTAGALSLLDLMPSEPILITNGDVITSVNYADILNFHVTHQASATMAVRRHEFQNPFGVVKTNGVEIIDIQEKPLITSNINAGIYVLSPSNIKKLKHNEYCDMPNFFRYLKKTSELTIAYPMHESWLDVGNSDDLIKANNDLDNSKSKKKD